MRKRVVGRIVVGAIVLLCAVLSIVYALQADSKDRQHRGLQALTFAIISVTGAVSYRYFED